MALQEERALQERTRQERQKPRHARSPEPLWVAVAPSVRATLAAAMVAVPLFGPLRPVLVADEVQPVSVSVAPSAQVVAIDQPAPVARPVGLAIPAIGVNETTMVDLGLDAEGRLTAPEDFARAGWFVNGPAPGAPGPAVIVGHVDSRQGPAVFFRVRELKPGDEILVPRADGSTARFLVDAVRQYPKDAFPADEVYGATADAQLRVITCGGSFDRSVRSYRDNIVVFASER